MSFGFCHWPKPVSHTNFSQTQRLLLPWQSQRNCTIAKSRNCTVDYLNWDKYGHSLLHMIWLRTFLRTIEWDICRDYDQDGNKCLFKSLFCLVQVLRNNIYCGLVWELMGLGYIAMATFKTSKGMFSYIWRNKEVFWYCYVWNRKR